MPIIYILTNQSMPDTIKIGITDNLERRIKELDNTSLPLPFECYYAVEVEDASKIEKALDFQFTPYEETITRIVKNYKA